MQAEREKLRQESERLRKEEEARRKREEEEARLRKEEEARRRREEEDARLRKEEEARRRKEEEDARLRKEEEARRRKEEEDARLRREEEARRRREEEEARLRREAEEARRRKEEELRAEQQRLAAEAERKRRDAEKLAELEAANKAEAARLAALAEANRVAQQELLAEAERNRAEEERARAEAAQRERAKALRKDGGVVPKKVTVPRTSYETLKKARPQIEAETKTSIDLTDTAAESSATVSGDSQNNVDNASRKIEDLINEDIRRDFGLQRPSAGEAEPEYMSWLKGKKTNMVVALSKIYDKYPQVLAIKRTFDSVDARDGISHGYLDKNEFVDNFETLFPMCKKGMGPEYAAYLFNSLDEDGNGTITWKEFIFYCLSNRLIVLNKEEPPSSPKTSRRR